MSPNNNETEEQKAERAETPFSTFLRYTDEKVETSKKVAEILLTLNKNPVSILDIGGGDGSLLKNSLEIANVNTSQIVIVDPTKKLLVKAKDNFSGVENVSFVEESFETWRDVRTFDIVIASHLYHIEDSHLKEQYTSFLGKVAPNGVLIFIMREVDDVFALQNMFIKKAMGHDYVIPTIDQSVGVFESMLSPSQMTRDKVCSRLSLPYKDSKEDTETILSFLLGQKGEPLEEGLIKEMYYYLQKTDGVLVQINGFIIIRNKV